MDTVLLVDDVKLNRELLRRMLSDSYTVLEADSGRQALEILLEQRVPVDAVLLDVMMPDVDGYAVMRAVRGGCEACRHPHHHPDGQRQ